MSVSDFTFPDFPRVCTYNCSAVAVGSPCPRCGHGGFMHTTTSGPAEGRPCDVCLAQASEVRTRLMMEELREAMAAWAGKSE